MTYDGIPTLLTVTLEVMATTHEYCAAGRAIVRQARKGAGFTQRELSLKCGVSPITIARIEAGITTSPKVETVLRILAGIGLTLEVVEIKNGEVVGE